MQRYTKLSHLLPILIGVLAVGGLLLGAQPAFATSPSNACNGTANDPDTCTGRTTGNGNVCLGDLSGFGTGINCTANDVTIGFADNVRDSNGNTISSCFQGSMLTNATADFHVVTSGGVTRFDIGLYLAIDGDPNNDGAKSGGCSVSKISSTNNISGNFLQLDATPDTCGDINNANKPQVVRITFSAPCQPSPLFFNPTTGQCQATAPSPTAAHCVILPNGVSWRQTGANDVCDSPIDAFPGTTSKCNVNPTFGIPVIVETASVLVGKSVAPTSVPETGGTVTYTVTVQNQSSQATYTIDTITDTIYGNLLNTTCDGGAFQSCTYNTCPTLSGTTVAAGGSTSCTFDAFVQGNSGTSLTDTAEVCGHDNFSHTGLCGHHDATVSFSDISTEPTVTKTATGAANCQLDATYGVTVANNSTIDPLTVDSVADDKFGDVTAAHAAGGGFEQVVSTTFGTSNCVSQIQPQGNCSFSFVGRIVSTSCSISHKDTVTATTHDDDGVTFTDTDDATVNVSVTFQ